MKNFTKNLMLVVAAATALSAGAEATWEFNTNSTNFLVGAQGGQGIMADFNSICLHGGALTGRYGRYSKGS